MHQYYLEKDDAGGSRFNQFAKYWSQKGHDVTILAGTVHYATGEKRPEYKRKFVVTKHDGPNITVKRCYVSRAYNKNSFGRMRGYVSFAFSTAVVGLFVKKPDIILCTSPPLIAGMPGVFLKNIKRLPFVFEVRDLWPEGPIDLGAINNKWVIKFLYWMQRVIYKSSTWINVLTPAFEKFLVDINGVPSEKISMIPNGADLDIIKPENQNNWVRQKHGLKNKFVVTYVGAHGVANSLMQMVGAARILKEEGDDQVQIMLVGDGMEKPMLIKEAAEHNLDNITFVDSVSKSQIGDYINASDVCAATLKRIEQYKTVYPNKIFDYMAAAKPIILGIDGIARELIEDAQTGIFVEPQNPRAFADAVMQLKNNPQLTMQFGQNGPPYVREHFSREKLAAKYLTILKELIQNKRIQNNHN